MISHLVHLEDDPHLLKILKVALTAMQPELIVTQFTTASALLNYIEQTNQPIDTVMLDIRVRGDMDGLAAAEKLRALGYERTLIISSAYEAPPRERLAQLDAEYIAKPWRIDSLLQRLLGQRVPSWSPRTQTHSAPPGVVPASFPSPAQRDVTVSLLQIEDNLEKLTRLLHQTFRVSGTVTVIIESDGSTIRQHIASPSGRVVPAQILSLALQTHKRGAPLFIEDGRGAFAGLPIESSEYAVILCAFDDQPRSWSAEDQRLLSTFGDMLASLLQVNQGIVELAHRNNELNTYTDTIAHDLKTPLAAIINYADIIRLLFDTSLVPDIDVYLSSISESASRMVDMITHLLWLARLEKPLESVGLVDMQPLFDSVFRRFEHLINKRGVRMAVETELLPVMGHEAWIEEVVANMISNAIKYIGDDNPAPCIWIRSYQVGNAVRYEIRYNGIGINADDQTKLFQSFTRLHKMEAEGIGLGLSIVQRIISRLTGTVGIESEPGAGSIFWFMLPAIIPDAPPTPLSMGTQERHP